MVVSRIFGVTSVLFGIFGSIYDIFWLILGHFWTNFGNIGPCLSLGLWSRGQVPSRLKIISRSRPIQVLTHLIAGSPAWIFQPPMSAFLLTNYIPTELPSAWLNIKPPTNNQILRSCLSVSKISITLCSEPLSLFFISEGEGSMWWSSRNTTTRQSPIQVDTCLIVA